MNTYRRYRCALQVNILATTPKEAAQKADELMRDLPSWYWVIIDEHGNEQTFEVPPLGRLPARLSDGEERDWRLDRWVT